MTPEVVAAIEEIRRQFPDNQIEFAESGDGGAFVIVHGLPLGDQYEPSQSWVGFAITFQYPHADVYPHFISGLTKRTDQKAFVGGFQKVKWRAREAIQISRRTKAEQIPLHTAALKLVKVLEWIQSVNR